MRRVDVHPPALAVRAAVAMALAEDLLPLGDITAALLEPGAMGQAFFVARKAGVLAGTHRLDLALVIVIGTLAELAGSYVSFTVGRRGGRPRWGAR